MPKMSLVSSHSLSPAAGATLTSNLIAKRGFQKVKVEIWGHSTLSLTPSCICLEYKFQDTKQFSVEILKQMILTFIIDVSSPESKLFSGQI